MRDGRGPDFHGDSIRACCAKPDSGFSQHALAHMPVGLLSARRDIDGRADLDWLREQLAVRDGLAPRTRAIMAELGERLFQ